MNRKIEEYVNNLFLRSPMSTQTKFAKQKLLTNAIKIYNDLLHANFNENEAYEKTISHINDTYDFINLYSQIEDENPNIRKKSAIITALSVMLYILCPVPVIILEGFGYTMEKSSIVMLFFMVGIATALLIYNSMSKPKNIYNNFCDSQIEYSKYYGLRKSISSILWALIVALYFFISFRYMNWAYSWIIFLIGAAIEQIIKAYFDYKEEKEYEQKI